MKASIVTAAGFALVIFAACGGKTDLGTTRGSSSGGGSGGSGSGGSSGGGPNNVRSCLATSSNTVGCIQCIENQCGTALDGFGNACGDFLACICPNGTYEPAAAQSSACQGSAQEPGCVSAAQAVGQCEQQQCTSACLQTGGGGSGGGGSSSSGGTGGGGMVTSCTVQPCASSSANDLNFCTSGGQCWYTVGNQTFGCASCQDTAACSKEANAACQ